MMKNRVQFLVSIILVVGFQSIGWAQIKQDSAPTDRGLVPPRIVSPNAGRMIRLFEGAEVPIFGTALDGNWTLHSSSCARNPAGSIKIAEYGSDVSLFTDPWFSFEKLSAMGNPGKEAFYLESLSGPFMACRSLAQNSALICLVLMEKGGVAIYQRVVKAPEYIRNHREPTDARLQ